MNKLLALSLLLTGSVLAQSAAPASATSASATSASAAPDWEGQIIYQVMPDRFSDGDKANNAGVNLSDPGAWHGGDLTGLTDRLEYIRTLGATAVWMTPVYQQVGPVSGVAGYHGYWPEDFQNVDPHFGTLDSFRGLTSKAHSLGLKVMLDQVINHYGYGATATVQNPGWFHTQADCAAAAAAHKDTDCPLSGLPDLNQTDPAVAALLNGNDDFWRAQGVDAFRYDAVKHVDQGYLKSLVARDRAAGTFTLGEYFGADADRVREYQDLGLGSLFEFSLQDALRRGIMSGQGLNGVRSVLEQDATAPHPGQIANFLDNHDLPRYANGTLFEDQGQTQTAYALRALMTLKGIPVIWQGTEYAQRGGKDPDNRRDMRFGSDLSAGEKAVYEVTRDAIAVRKASPALSVGTQRILDGSDNTDDLLAFVRSHEGHSVVVAWNNAKVRRTYALDTNFDDQNFTSSLFHEPDGEIQNAGMSARNNHVYFSLPAKSAAVFKLGSD